MKLKKMFVLGVVMLAVVTSLTFANGQKETKKRS